MSELKRDSRWEEVQVKMDAAADKGWHLFVRRTGEAAREVLPTVAALFEAIGPYPECSECLEIEVLWKREDK